jgi:hypothetical protein
MEQTQTRPLWRIAEDIQANWDNVNFAAKPYLQAMHHLNTINDKWGMDDAKSIVLYFLNNAGSWRGEHARRIKVELKKMAGVK